MCVLGSSFDHRRFEIWFLEPPEIFRIRRFSANWHVSKCDKCGSYFVVIKHKYLCGDIFYSILKTMRPQQLRISSIINLNSKNTSLPTCASLIYSDKFTSTSIASKSQINNYVHIKLRDVIINACWYKLCLQIMGHVYGCCIWVVYMPQNECKHTYPCQILSKYFIKLAHIHMLYSSSLVFCSYIAYGLLFSYLWKCTSHPPMVCRK